MGIGISPILSKSVKLESRSGKPENKNGTPKNKNARLKNKPKLSCYDQHKDCWQQA
jgi:hypothetical protein